MTRVSFLQQRKGFSLAELIIYLGILGISAGIFGGMLNTITNTQISEFNQNEVSGQLNFAIQTIQRYVRTASIVQGDSGVSSSTLVLQMPTTVQNPTTIYLQNNRIYVTQGASGTPLAITNDKVSIDNLEFRRFAQPASKDVVQIDIAISQQSAGGARISRSLRSAITRVNAAAFDSDLIPNADGTYNVGIYPSARWKDGSFSGQVSAGSLCFGSDCRTSWANIAGVSGSGSANYVAKWNTASTINASTLLYDNGTNVGVGAINPGYKLDVQGGQINTSGGLCINGDCKTAWSQVGGSQWTTTSTSIYYNTGNVGIGTTAPGAKLTVDGSGETVIKLQSSGTEFGEIGTYSSGLIIGTNTALPLNLETNNTARMTILGGGNVGVGTTTPAYTLDVNGSIRIPTTGILRINRPADNGAVEALSMSNSPLVNEMIFGSLTADHSMSLATNGARRMTLLNTGNIGIGTTAPTAKLQVASTTATEGVRIISSDYSPFIIRNSADSADLFRVSQTGTTTIGALAGTGTRSVMVDASGVLSATSTSGGGSSQWTTTGTSIYYNTGNVGIGTTAPDNLLTLGNVLLGSWGGKAISIGDTTGNATIGVGKNASTEYAAMRWNNANSNLEFYTPNKNVVFTTGSGNVGVGTTAPAYKLQILAPTNTEGFGIISSNYSPLVIRNSANSADLFRIDQSGNITISGLFNIGPVLRFSRTTSYPSDPDTTKDSACVTDFGSNYQAASVNDAAIYGSMGISGGTGSLIYFVVGSGDNSSMYRYDADATTRTAYIYWSSASGSLYSVACVRKDAPFRFSRTTAYASDSDTTKDSACVTDFGSNYQAAGVIDISARGSMGISGGVGSVLYFLAAGDSSSAYRYTADANKIGYVYTTAVGATPYHVACARKN